MVAVVEIATMAETVAVTTAVNSDKRATEEFQRTANPQTTNENRGGKDNKGWKK
jgi:hypothetical protein